MSVDACRRQFLVQGLGGLSAAWFSANWPALVSAAEHAHSQAKSNAPAKFEFFSAEEAAEIDAISARIIPATDTPGAREAGVVYFIDRALVTYAKDDQKIYTDGLTDLQAHISEKFPETKRFSAASPEQQDQILRSLDESATSEGRGRRSRAAGSFFESVRTHTIMGFLIDPESDRRGNRDAVGWKVIGRDPGHTFQPPFGFYDKDYSGYQLTPAPSIKGEA